MLLWVALLQSGFPQEAIAVKTKTLICSLASVQESGDIGLQGEQQAEEEDGKSSVSSTHLHLMCHKWCLWCETSHFSLLPCVTFSVTTRQTPAQHFLTEIRTPLNSAGSSRSPRCRSDWEILQVRGRHTATLSTLNHSQSTSTKSFVLSPPSYFPTHTPKLILLAHTHTHARTSSGISSQLPPSLLIAFWNHKPYLDCVIKSLSFISSLSQEQAQRAAASGSWFTPGLKWKAGQRRSSSCVAG